MDQPTQTKSLWKSIPLLSPSWLCPSLLLSFSFLVTRGISWHCVAKSGIMHHHWWKNTLRREVSSTSFNKDVNSAFHHIQILFLNDSRYNLMSTTFSLRKNWKQFLLPSHFKISYFDSRTSFFLLPHISGVFFVCLLVCLFLLFYLKKYKSARVEQ